MREQKEKNLFNDEELNTLQKENVKLQRDLKVQVYRHLRMYGYIRIAMSYNGQCLVFLYDGKGLSYWYIMYTGSKLPVLFNMSNM